MSIICPKCKSENIIPIVYGNPAAATKEAAERGELMLGGSGVIDGFQGPDRYCKQCGFSWSVDRLTSTDVKKVRFSYWSNWGYYDSDSVQENRWSYDILADGTISYCSYPMQGRQILDKGTVQIDKTIVMQFYEDLLYWFKPWSYAVDAMVCDGCSYELTISYADGRKRRKRGDVAGGSIDNCVMKFLRSVPGMRMDEDIAKEY
ncbi:MAG: hypothetical protein MR016_04755 [Agathobacter sp.]|nr:hypothetical protein [Agathobacter sp.]